MRTMADDGTADQLLDYLASDGHGAEWTCYADLADWESLYNLHNERGMVGRLTRNLTGRGLADVRRASSGMQLRLTPTGEALAGERRDRLDRALVGLSEGRWSGESSLGGRLVRFSRPTGRRVSWPRVLCFYVYDVTNAPNNNLTKRGN